MKIKCKRHKGGVHTKCCYSHGNVCILKISSWNKKTKNEKMWTTRWWWLTYFLDPGNTAAFQEGFVYFIPTVGTNYIFSSQLNDFCFQLIWSVFAFVKDLIYIYLLLWDCFSVSESTSYLFLSLSQPPGGK